MQLHVLLESFLIKHVSEGPYTGTTQCNFEALQWHQVLAGSKLRRYRGNKIALKSQVVYTPNIK